MQEDRSKTILQTQNSVESISITAVLPSRLFPLPRYYRDVCSHYRHYRSKIYSVAPVFTDYRGITVVPITVQLSSRLNQPRRLAYISRWLTHLQMVTHPSTNWARCRVLTLIETNMLPLSKVSIVSR